MKKNIETREDIELLINSFYKKVRQDECIGFIFNDIAKVDWDHHLPIMYSFWESVLLDKYTYKGNAMEPHIRLSKKVKLLPEHFSRWLKLFYTSVDEHFTGPGADAAKERAANIASLMQLKVQQ
ncbi:MAG: group III truncated hemoglobin [Bacteroidia bacterium]